MPFLLDSPGNLGGFFWLLFTAQSWALWLIRNKATIDSLFVRQPADVIFKTLIFLQLWAIGAKQQDREEVHCLASELRTLYSSLSTPVPLAGWSVCAWGCRPHSPPAGACVLVLCTLSWLSCMPQHVSSVNSCGFINLKPGIYACYLKKKLTVYGTSWCEKLC